MSVIYIAAIYNMFALYSMSSTFFREHLRAPRAHKLKHRDAITGYRTPLLLETFFHYGSGGLFQLLVDAVENFQ
jgi:hypothetical protein